MAGARRRARGAALGALLVALWCARGAASCACSRGARVAVVSLAHSRAAALQRSLASVEAAFRAGAEPRVARYVSVDGNPRAARVENGAKRSGVPEDCIMRHEPVKMHSPRERIAAHYLHTLNRIFANNTGHQYAIILEDDLIVSPDFSSYIHAFLPFLHAGNDNDLSATLCVSGWNDNGASPAFHDEHAARRTSFFPGLGWALSRGAWRSLLRDAWPGQDGRPIVGIGWDFWLRTEFALRAWNCITPDVPRVYHFGKAGTNVGQAEKEARFDASKIAALPEGAVDWEHVAHRMFDGFESGSGRHSALADRLRETLSLAAVLPALPSIASAASKSTESASAFGQLLSDALACPKNPSLRAEEESPPEAEHFLLPYHRAIYEESIARQLHLWPSPRGDFHHVLTMRLVDNCTLHVVDAQRASHLLPGKLLRELDRHRDRFRLSVARTGESCAAHCDDAGCSAVGLELGNVCATLKNYFPCARCAYETGADLPAYVVPGAGGKLATEGLCLVTESGTSPGGTLDCHGSYPYTRRLCACNRRKDSDNPSREEEL